MIVFKTLKWKNFISTGNIFTEIDLCKSKTTLIVGENGAGKSTILDALTYALFGKPFRKINKPQLVNSITRKDMVVEIEFQVGRVNYTIVRGMKPNVFEVYQNGMLVNQAAEMRDYQEYLEKHILKLNFKSFCQVVVLGSASFVPFMQLPAAQRREIIEDLLDLQIFTTMNTILKDKIQVNGGKVTDATTDQKIINEKIKIFQEHMLEKQNSNEKIIAEKVSLIDETAQQIKDMTQDFYALDRDITELQKYVENQDQVKSKINKLNTLKHQIEAKTKQLSEEISFLNNHDNCPTCAQVIDPEFKKQHIKSKQTTIAETEGGLVLLSSKYDEANKELQQIMENNSIISQKEFEKLRLSDKIKSLIKYSNQLEKEIKNINELYESDESEKIAALQEDLNKCTEILTTLLEQKQVYTIASILLKDGGIKSRIIKQYVPIINKLIGKYLSALDFFVQFELDEEFNETIKSRFRDEFSYASFSEGEKMRINLAILFTWRAVAKLRNSVSTNLLIMDEVFDSSLDSTGTEEFLKILQQLTQDTNTFIISHKTDQLYDKFESVLRFEKKQNFSRLAGVHLS